MSPNDPKPFSGSNIDGSAEAGRVNDYLGKQDSALAGAKARASGAVANDPDYVKVPESFGHYTLEDLLAKAAEIKPANMHALANDWELLAGSAAPFAGGLIASALDQRWNGKTADAAAAASTQFFRALAETTTAVGAVAARVKAAAFATDAVGLALAATFQKVATKAALPGLADAAEAQRQADLKEEARREMTAALARIAPASLYPTGSGVPEFTPPSKLTGGASDDGRESGAGNSQANSLLSQPATQRPGPVNPHAADQQPQPAVNATTPQSADTASNSLGQQQNSATHQGQSGLPAPHAAPTIASRGEFGGQHYQPGQIAPVPGAGSNSSAADSKSGGSSPAAKAIPGLPGTGALPRPRAQDKKNDPETQRPLPDWMVTAANGESLFGTPKGVATRPVLGVWDDKEADKHTIDRTAELAQTTRFPGRGAEQNRQPLDV